MKLKKGFILLGLMVASSSGLQSMQRKLAQPITQRLGNSPVITQAKRYISSTEAPGATKPISDPLIRTRMDGYKESFNDFNSWARSKRPSYDYTGMKNSMLRAGKFAGGVGAAGSLGMNYYQSGQSAEREAVISHLWRKGETYAKEKFDNQETAFNASPGETRKEDLLKAYFEWLPYLDREELEDEYRGSIDQLIQQKEKDFDNAWSAKGYRSKQDDTLRDSQKHDLDQEIKGLGEILYTLHKKTSQNLIRDLIAVISFVI